MKKFLTVSAVAMGFASTALAGNLDPVVVDVPPVAATVPAAPDWGGFYLGASFSTGVGGNSEYRTNGIVDSTYATLEAGSALGVFAGYNIQRNNLVFGGEVAYSAVNTPGYGVAGWPNEYHEYFLDGKARVGFAANKVLVYGFVGYSSSVYHVVSPPANWTVSGMNYGAGVDVMLGERLFMGAEYISRDLSGATSSANQVQNTNVQEIQLRAGLKF